MASFIITLMHVSGQQNVCQLATNGIKKFYSCKEKQQKNRQLATNAILNV
jgi:hypothetical protein